jgi:PAS domain S-box-containing protein
VHDAQGAVCGIIHSVTDVTARMQLSAEREQELLYQLFEQTPMAIAILRGTNLRVELANPAVAAIWGRKPEQVLGRPYFEAVPDTAGQGFEQILADVLTTGQPFTITEAPVTLARAHTGQPEQAYVTFVFQPLHDAQGDTAGLIASGTEVTEQVLARRKVQELNAKLAASNEELEARVLARTQEVQLAQAQAEADRATLQRVFEQAPMALAILEGPTHVITLANAEMGLIWGRDPAALLGRPHFEALPDLAGQGFEAIFADVYRTGQPCYLREQPVRVNRTGNGPPALGYYHITYQPLHDVQGHITALTASAVDVTEQVLARRQMQGAKEQLELRVAERTAQTQVALRQAEQQREQLREQQGLLRQILRQVPASVATLSGPEHRFTFFNDHYLDLTNGRARLGGTVAELLPEVVEQGFIDLLDRVYTTGEPFLGNELSILLHPAADQRPTQRHLDFVYQPLTDGQGRTLGILVFAVDVTDKVLARRQAETLQAAMLAAVRHQKEDRENVFLLFEQSPAVICLLREPEHRIEYLNPAYQALFPGQPLRGHLLAAVQPQTTALVVLLDGIYKSGTAQFQPEVPITIASLGGLPPRTRYFDFTYQAYREQERIAGVSIFGLDVTEQVLARRKVLELNEELQASNQELGTTNRQLTRTNADLDTFVYTASHDLKVPIANIEGLLDALSRELRSQEAGNSVAHLLDLMQESVARFQQTIGHLTDISRLQQEEHVPGEAGSLAATIANVQLDLAPLLATTGAQVTVELADAPTLPLSPKNLRSVVYNLLSNALKYRAPDRRPVVRIESQQQGDTVVLHVHDNGLGLDERQQQRLFGLFQRLHAHVEGSGVGLYMVRKIVENAGGTVQVRSQPDVGTTFTVTLPRPPEHLAN